MSLSQSAAAGERVILLGGTSEIGLAVARELQRRAPRRLVLVGRDPDRLESAADTLRGSGSLTVATQQLDALHVHEHAAALDHAFAEHEGADIVILAVGVLGERGGLPANIESAVEVLEINAVAAGSLLMHSAARLRARGGGTVIVLSSVAAERPRAANVVYGASKAGLDALARGLDEALCNHGVRVLVVRPGFVHTRMTAGLKPAPLACTAEQVASIAVDGVSSGAAVVWAPRQLRWLMLILRMLPRRLFRMLEQ